MKKILIALIIFSSLLILNCTSQNDPVNKLVISSFIENSSLQQAGAQQGDVIYKYNGKLVLSQDHLIQLRNKTRKTELSIVLLRDGNEIKLKIPAGQLGVMLKEFLPDHEPMQDAVIIEGIGKLDWGSGMDNSFLACAYLLEQKYGNQLSYEDLVGISGYAFRLHFFDRFCPSSPDATVGFDNGSYLLSQLGYKHQYYFSDAMQSEDSEQEFHSEEEIRQAITESIAKGWPVIAIDLIETPEWGLITGYQNKGQELFCRTFFDNTEGYDLADKSPWAIIVIEDKENVEITPLYHKSLQIAHEMYETPRYGEYFSGLKAAEEWIKALQDEAYYQANSQQLAEISHANWWIYVSLQIARAIGSNYLQNNLTEFNADNDIILELSQIYQQESQLLMDNSDVLPRQQSSTGIWTNEMRNRQVTVMENFLQLERKALQMIKNSSANK